MVDLLSASSVVMSTLIRNCWRNENSYTNSIKLFDLNSPICICFKRPTFYIQWHYDNMRLKSIKWKEFKLSKIKYLTSREEWLHSYIFFDSCVYQQHLTSTLREVKFDAQFWSFFRIISMRNNESLSHLFLCVRYKSWLTLLLRSVSLVPQALY